MELLPVLRLIWRRRLPLVVGVVIAAVVLVLLGGTKPVTTPSAVAWTSVALDTPESQLVGVAPRGGDSLAWRASLLTHLMASASTTQELAERAGVSARQVTVVDPALALPLVPTAMAQAAATAASGTVTPYVLTVFTKNDLLPVISIEAAAPNSGTAERLAHAAIAVLESQASRGGHFTSHILTSVNALSRQPFVVEQVTPLRVKALPSTALPVKAIGASFFVFVVWSAGVLLVLPLFRRRTSDGRALPA